MSDLGSGDEGMSGQKIQQNMKSGGADFDSGQQGMHGEEELATKMLQIQSKRFYLDVKQNRRGRFIKVAEIGADGRRSQIFLALSTAAEFRDHLSEFSDFYASLGPPNPDNVPEDGKLRSEMMIKDNRRYYLDLKENSRGRFLRVSQTITRGGPRSQIAIPAQGMIEFRDALTDLLDEFGTDDGGFRGELPEGRHLRVENKNFYFDIGQNNRGIYMRISEVKSNFRTAITVPEKSWTRFRDILVDYCDKIKQAEQGQGSAGSGQQGASGGQSTSAGGSGQQRSLKTVGRSRSSSLKPIRKPRSSNRYSVNMNYEVKRRRRISNGNKDRGNTDPRKTRSAPLNKRESRKNLKNEDIPGKTDLGGGAGKPKTVAFKNLTSDIKECSSESYGQFVEIRKTSNNTQCSSSSASSISPNSSEVKLEENISNKNDNKDDNKNTQKQEKVVNFAENIIDKEEIAIYD
ncbi:transcriptional activator protein Pur-beta [Chrysoperla carnea]|uniref:transcriptional activator protein Pur-beta n=1 Tax=Chrysoperla carnea TaxID=189513 RepID=UPI001D05D11E|nr:transcriptional activator protein Pur-beta [Chrysoperla carnea]